jgi:hypothetical protein
VSSEQDVHVDPAVSMYNSLPDEIFLNHVISKLGVSDRMVVSRVDRRTRALVKCVAGGGDRLRVSDFVNSVARLRWAQANDCIWEKVVGGHRFRDILYFTKNQYGPRGEMICAWAAYEGQLEVLMWMREQEPPCAWNAVTCGWAAFGGQLEVMEWMRGQEPPCSWNATTCAWAALGGQLEMLKWLRAQSPPCLWDDITYMYATDGQLQNNELLECWVVESDCPSNCIEF